MGKDLFADLGDELRILFKKMSSFEPQRTQDVRIQMEKIVSTASQIGGAIAAEALQLKKDVEDFLRHPKDPRLASLMRKHALRLEQETREL